jgi:aldehyde dehydrogenase (NAD+)
MAFLATELSWLSELGIEAECKGVYDGTWKTGSGEELISICPGNGRPIAMVKSASKAEYEDVIKNSTAAFKIWRQVHIESKFLIG